MTDTSSPASVCLVEYDNDTQSVHLIWNGYASSEQLRQSYEDVLRLIKKHSAKKSLSDNRQMKLFSAEDQEWLNDDYLPRVKAAGLRYTAVIMPVNYFARIGVENVIQKVQPDEIEVQYFQTVPEAKSWLKTIEHTHGIG